MKTTKDSAKAIELKVKRAEITCADAKAKAEQERQAKLAENDCTVEQEIKAIIKKQLEVDSDIIEEDKAILSYCKEVEKAFVSGDEERLNILIPALSGMIVKSKLKFHHSGCTKSMKKTETDSDCKVKKTVWSVYPDGKIIAGEESKGHESAKAINFDDKVLADAFSSLCKGEPNYNAQNLLGECSLSILERLADFGSLTESVTIARKSDKDRAYIKVNSDGERETLYAQKMIIEDVQVSKIVFRDIEREIDSLRAPKDDFSFYAEDTKEQYDDWSGDSIDTVTYKLDKLQTALADDSTRTLDDVRKIDSVIESLTQLHLNSKESKVLALRLQRVSQKKIAETLNCSEWSVRQYVKSIQKKFIDSKLADNIPNLHNAMQYVRMDKDESSAFPVSVEERAILNKESKSLEIRATNLDTGDYIVCSGVRETCRQLEEQTGVKVAPSHVTSVLKGRRRQSKGYTFEYVFDTENAKEYKRSREQMQEFTTPSVNHARIADRDNHRDRSGDRLFEIGYPIGNFDVKVVELYRVIMHSFRGEFDSLFDVRDSEITRETDLYIMDNYTRA